MTAPQRHHTTETTPTVRRISFQGHEVRLAADKWPGDPERTVLFLHGGGQTREAWGRSCAKVASLGCRVVSLDLRGHGDSDWPDEPDYDFEHFGTDVLEVLDALGPAPIGVGASLGGMSLLTAQRLQADPRTQIYSGVVLVDITPKMEIGGVRRILTFMTAHPEGFASLDQAASAIADYMPHREPPKDTTGLQKVLRETEDGRWRWHWDLRFITSRVGEGPDFVELDSARYEEIRRGLLEGARRLAVPTDLVRGTKSDLVSDEGVAELLDAVPQGRYVDVRDATHMVAGDENDAFSDAVVDFARHVYNL
jgi:pimeloyl-ACP methyl ester carboxylesterase